MVKRRRSARICGCTCANAPPCRRAVERGLPESACTCDPCDEHALERARAAATALGIPAHATIRAESMNCGKRCANCPHGPYFVAVWRTPDGMRKKYLGAGARLYRKAPR